MLSKENFRKAIQRLMDFENLNQKLRQLGINIMESEPLSNIIVTYIDLLESAMDDKNGWTSWWLSDTQYGSDDEFNVYWDKGVEMTEENAHRVRTVDELYEVIVKETK